MEGQWLLVIVLAITALVLWRAEIVAGARWLYRRVRPLPPEAPVARLFGGGGSAEPEAPDYWPQEYHPKYWWPISYWPKVGTTIVAAPAAAAADERPHIRMDVRRRRGA